MLFARCRVFWWTSNTTEVRDSISSISTSDEALYSNLNLIFIVVCQPITMNAANNSEMCWARQRTTCFACHLPGLLQASFSLMFCPLSTNAKLRSCILKYLQLSISGQFLLKKGVNTTKDLSACVTEDIFHYWHEWLCTTACPQASPPMLYSSSLHS